MKFEVEKFEVEKFEVQRLIAGGWILAAGDFLGIVRSKGSKGTKGCFTGASRK